MRITFTRDAPPQIPSICYVNIFEKNHKQTLCRFKRCDVMRTERTISNVNLIITSFSLCTAPIYAMTRLLYRSILITFLILWHKHTRDRS